MGHAPSVAATLDPGKNYHRAEKRRIETAERTLMAEILGTMTRRGLSTLRAERAIAKWTGALWPIWRRRGGWCSTSTGWLRSRSGDDAAKA